MTFYKLFCLIYRRTDYYKLDRIRRKLMYPNYYAEKEKRARYKLAELMLPLNILANTLDCKKWL